MTEKWLEKRWILTCFLLITPTVLRVFDLMTEGGLLTAWGVAGSGFLAAEAYVNAGAKKEQGDA
jgi:hypothetical protein